MKTLALTLVTTFALSTSAFAQVDDDEPIPVPDDLAGDEVEMGADDAPDVPFDEEGSPSGADENPDAPVPGKVLGKAAPAAAPSAYSRQLVERPLTLLGGSLQVGLSAGFGGLTEKIAYGYDGNDHLVRAGAVLSAEYGITDAIQVGLHYGGGTFGTLEDDAGNKDSGYSTGKTVAVEAFYRLTDWVALQAEVPINVEPVEVALTLGAPMKFRFGDKMALFVLEDFITIAFNDFVPITADATSNEFAASEIEDNEIIPDRDITVKGGVIYQMSNKAALKGTFGIVAPDFKMDEDPGALLMGELFYSMSEKLDLYGSAGIFNLSDASSSLHVGGGLALRL